MDEQFPGVYEHDGQLLTKNLVPGYRSHSEHVIEYRGEEYRVWDPSRSKPAAGMKKGLKTFPVTPGCSVLYLGAANGNTVSFFSDIVGTEGVIYAVEISERSMRDLAALAEKRKNVVPILANAKLPSHYDWVEQVDVVFQDVATSDQSEIMMRNMKAFLKPGGTGMLALKARSIDVVKQPKQVFDQEQKKLAQSLQVTEAVPLDPYEKDHLLLVLRLSTG